MKKSERNNICCSSIKWWITGFVILAIAIILWNSYGSNKDMNFSPGERTSTTTENGKIQVSDSFQSTPNMECLTAAYDYADGVYPLIDLWRNNMDTIPEPTQYDWDNYKASRDVGCSLKTTCDNGKGYCTVGLSTEEDGTTVYSCVCVPNPSDPLPPEGQAPDTGGGNAPTPTPEDEKADLACFNRAYGQFFLKKYEEAGEGNKPDESDVLINIQDDENPMRNEFLAFCQEKAFDCVKQGRPGKCIGAQMCECVITETTTSTDTGLIQNQLDPLKSQAIKKTLSQLTFEQIMIAGDLISSEQGIENPYLNRLVELTRINYLSLEQENAVVSDAVEEGYSSPEEERVSEWLASVVDFWAQW